MAIEEYFATGPAFERPVFDAVLEVLHGCDPALWFEPVSVGIFFKRRTTFVQLRTMTKWVAVGFSLPVELRSPRLSRKVVHHGQRYFHVVNVSDASQIDEELASWLVEAWVADA